MTMFMAIIAALKREKEEKERLRKQDEERPRLEIPQEPEDDLEKKED